MPRRKVEPVSFEDEGVNVLEDLPEDAVDFTPPYPERFAQTVAYLLEQTDGTGKVRNEELFGTFARGEFTVFTYRESGVDLVIPEQDDRELMPHFEAIPARILQTTARFVAGSEKWMHVQGPRAAFLDYDN